MAELAPNLEVLRAEAEAFVMALDELHGLYLDATMGFEANVWLLEKGREAAAAAGVVPTDDSAFFVSDGEPGTPTNVLLHRTTQGDFIARNRPGGRNYVRLAQMLIVLAFEYWETEFRHRLAKALGIVNSSDLTVPTFGDLRLLRHDIIHAGGIVSKATVERLEAIGKVIPVVAGATLALTEADVRALTGLLKSSIDIMVVAAGGENPSFSSVRRVV